MKKFLTSAGLVALGVSGLQAAYAPDLTEMEASKPWSVSAALRGFYDDNYTTSPSSVSEESFGYEFTPSVSLNLPRDQTFLGASYEYSLKYYEARKNGKYDQSHKFDGRLDHAFSERYKIEVDDSFVIAQEPEILAPSGTAPGTALRTEGDNIRNLGSIRFTAQATELLALELAYANTFYDYQQDESDVPPGVDSRSGLLDRMEHLASLDLRWQVVPDTDVILGYAYGMVDFNGDEQITNPDVKVGGRVPSDERNSRSHRVYVGADHRFNAQLSASVRIGGEHTDFYNAGESTVSPYADANVTYQYNRANSIQVGLTHRRNQTDVASLDQETTVVYGSITHKITPNLIGSLLVQGQYSTFEKGANDGDNEIFLISGLNLTYHFNPHFLAEAGYNFDRLDSDVGGRSYSRNRVYVGVRATY
ncbi:MAG: outer membrane beta-barrel protein [Verrucomicrobiota bacterium]